MEELLNAEDVSEAVSQDKITGTISYNSMLSC